MEIEVITTKKKLSKSVIKQLNPASIGDMNFLNSTDTCGYYVRDLGAKYADRVGVFKGINGWVFMSLRGWKPSGEIEATCKPLSGRGVAVKTFASKNIRDQWVDAYSKAEQKCLKNHLIL